MSTERTRLAALLAQVAQALAEETEPAPKPERRPMPTRVLLTVAEAADQLGIGKTKANELIKSGELHSVRIGRLRRVHIDSIRQYAAQLVSQEAA
jgi:excisionase family DNA binding protein